MFDCRSPLGRTMVGGIALAGTLLGAGVASAATVDLPRYPSLSPDGREVVFSWRGDLWKASVAGGSAIRLTSHPADELRSAWSPDGQLIAFESDRDGYRNLFVMRTDGTGIQQVTEGDTALALAGFATGADGAPTLTFDASLEGDLFRSQRPYQIGLAGGTPTRVLDAFGTFAQLSPHRDGEAPKVLFERGGSAWFRRGYRGPDARDVWLFDTADGTFRRLTDWVGNDGMARWTSGEAMVFLSDRGPDGRNGAINLFRQAIAPGATATQLTNFSDADIHWLTVSGDGKRAIVANWDGLYSVDLTANAPNATKLTLTANEDGLDDRARRSIVRDATEAVLSPDGQSVALVAYGDIWVRGTADRSVARRLSDGVGRERDVAWSADGLTLYFVSDSGGAGESIYAATVDRTREELRKRTDERLHPPQPEPAPASDAPPADPATKEPGEKSAAPAATGEEPAAQKEDAPEEDDKAAKKPAEKKKKDPALDPARWADAITFSIKPLIDEASSDTRPVPSPDGRSIAFRRGNGDVMALDIASGSIRPLVHSFDADIEYRWSPDSTLIAYAVDDRNFNSDIWLVPADGSAPARNITRHPDTDRSPRFSADGKVLAFVSERTNEEYDVWTVFLEKDLESLRGKDLEQYYKDAADAAKKRKPLEPRDPNAAAKVDSEKPAEPDRAAAAPEAPSGPFGELDLDDAYLRVRRVTNMLGNEGNLELLPSGEKLIFSGSEGREASLFSIKTDGTGVQKIGPSGRVQELNFAGDRVVLIANGAAQSIAAGGGDAKTYDLAESIDIDFPAQNEQKFREMARVLGAQFYHPSMKDLDWPGLTERYLELAKRARTGDEFDWVANRMLGELNASHLGVRSPESPSPLRQAQGRLGARTRPVEGGFEVTELIESSPAALGKIPLAVGDVITAIDFTPFATGDSVEKLLAGKVGKEVVVSLRRPVSGGEALHLDLLLVPISSGELSRLLYGQSTRRNAQLVEEWSNGRLGYIHIRGMDQSSLDNFERDLYASADGKQGLLIDVRNNGGGSTADLLLSSIMVKPHAYAIPRGGERTWLDAYPQDRLYIQRYTLPINMLCNEKSFSNAEIISHAFKTLGRGTLVGQQTYGGVISTGGTTLLDGTTVRLPFRGWYLPDGTDMENNGAIPDLIVPQTPEDEARQFDAQLKAAVDDLLQRLDAPGNSQEARSQP